MATAPHRRRLTLGVAADAGLAMAVLCAARLKVTTDITHFLPAGDDRGLGQLSRQLADSALTRNLIVSIGAHGCAGERGRRPDGGRLARHPGGLGQRGPTEGLAEAVYPPAARTAPLVVQIPDQPEAGSRACSTTGAGARGQALKRQLALPTAPLV
jgi:hypothetical protein